MSADGRTGVSPLFAGSLLLLATIVTAIATYSHATREIRPNTLPAAEIRHALEWLDEFYRSEAGLRRPEGLIINGRLDYDAISVWIFQQYMQSRAYGRTPEQALELIAESIRQSPEWQAVHRP